MTVGDSPADWPPPGWTEDVKITSGRKTKYYTHVETGKKFYSKKEVTRYMNTKDTCHDVAQVLNQDKSSTENNVSQMNHQDKSFSENNVSQMNYQDRSCSENNVSQIVEETKKSPEWLPAGWIVELKTRKSGSNAGLAYKVYIDPSTGNKFYSRPEVSKYLKTMKQNDITGEEQIHGTGEVSSSNQKASENSKDIGGLSRISKRQKSDGNRPSHDIKEGSFSKRKPSQDSEEVGEPSCISKTHKSGINRPSTKTSASHGAGEDSSLNEKASLNSKENGVQSPSSKRQKPGSDSPSAMTVAVDCNSVDELPPGWKKEVIIRQTDRGIRKDPVYTDPVHGYKFRSKKEVFRYLQTGDTSKCARRHSKRNAASTMKDNSHTTDDASLKKSECFVTGRQLFATEEAKGENSFFTCSPAQQVESSKKLPDCSVSDPNIIITSILAEINENHSFEDVNEDAEIGTVSVGVETLSAVSTQSDLLPEQQLPENEQEKHNYKAGTQQSGKSRNPKSLKPGRRVSKRLAGREPEAATDLDLGEHALPAVVEKSASLNVCGQELLQHSDPTPETGNSDQASLSGEASVDELPPGWKKEIKVTKKARGIRKDPLYTDPVHGYVFRSKKDVLRYLQTGDISKCAIKPFKRDLDATMKESSPAAHNTSSKKLGCAMTERQPFAAEEARGEKRAVTYSPAVQAESSKKQRENSASNANTSITSAADINTKHSCENVIENAEMSLDTEPEIRDSNADTKVITAESVVAERLSAVSTPLSDLLPGQQLPENEQEKHINKETPKQSRRSRNKKSITPGRRISKRLVGHSPEPVANLDLGERAFRAVVKKSASLGIPLNDCCQELVQNEDLTVGTGNSDQASLSREASADELPPGLEKEILAQNKDPTVGIGNSDQASLSREASVDELPPGLEKETLAPNKDPTVGTGNSDQASLSTGASAEELPPTREKEILAPTKDPTVGTGNSEQALSREASADQLPPGWDKGILSPNKDSTAGTGNSDQASLSREASAEELRPAWEKEILAPNKDPTVGTGYSVQASLSKEASADELPPGWGKEILIQNKDLSGEASADELPPGFTWNKGPTLGTGNSDQASLTREPSADDLPPGFTWNKGPRVGTNNSDQASLSREASADELPPGFTWNNGPTVRTGNSDQASLIREASADELPPGFTWNKGPTGRTGNSDQASLSREASADELPPGFTRNKDPTGRTGNSDQASLSREASADELPPGFTWNNCPTVETGNSDQAFLSREASADELPPGWEKEILAQKKDPTVGTGNSYQSFLRREASVDELPPGWKKEIRIRQNARGIRKDPFYTDPVHGYVFRSKKDVMRYLQTGDISRCAMRPTKRDPDSEMKGNSPSTRGASSKKLGCSLSGRQPFSIEELKGGECFVTYSLALQAESSNEHPESSVFNNTISSSTVADTTEKHSCGNVNVDAEIRLDMERELRDSIGDTKAIAAESVDVKRSLAVSPQMDFFPELQLPENKKKKHSNKKLPAQSRKIRNEESFTPVRRVSKRLSGHYSEVVPDLNVGECGPGSVSSGHPLTVSGRELSQQADLATLDQAFLRKIALSQDDPLEIVKCPSEGQAFKEQKAAKELTSEKQDDRRILRDPQPAEISYEIGKVHLEHQVVKERPTAQDSQKRLLNNSWPAQLAWGNRVLPVENQYVSERCSVEQVSEKHDYENMQLRDSQLGESSQRSRELNVENQPVREKQTGELVTENQDEQSRRLQAQLASYPFGDYWSDPCMEFAFKTLTGAIPVEDTLAFQGSSQQEFNTSYTQADDGCFELPLFNTSSFYMNDVPSHCTPSEERVPLEQPPITQTFLPTGSNSMPGCSSVVSQSPGLDTQAKDYQSKVKSQCPGMDTQANKSNFFAHWK
ncbi:uncharacterized protein [Nicotiana sylvestris]|uniref:Uncharacterized protein LOC104231139 isoform X2 n=1 Tax=Nicotiana sylvestris TaxID=4096 RepID=A0A1U7WYJ9_NICSY|nr:PREDICTED: uncharacterized protein LOC104231139 isoform X2 [Nicotiana sylvestris]